MLGRELRPTEIADGVVRLGTDLVHWFLVEDGGRVTVVDCGLPAYRPQLEPGLRALGRTAKDVAAVVLTHPHPDHAGFAERLRVELGVPVHVHHADEALAASGKRLGKREAPTARYLGHPHAWKFLTHFNTSGAPEKIGAVRTFTDGETLDVPGALRVVHTGGHTAGHVVLHLGDRGVLFLGDLLCSLNPLTGARGPQLLPRALNVSSVTMLDSLAKIEAIDAPVLAFGHGDPWTGGTAEAVRLARAAGLT